MRIAMPRTVGNGPAQGHFRFAGPAALRLLARQFDERIDRCGARAAGSLRFAAAGCHAIPIVSVICRHAPNRTKAAERPGTVGKATRPDNSRNARIDAPYPRQYPALVAAPR